MKQPKILRSSFLTIPAVILIGLIQIVSAQGGNPTEFVPNEVIIKLNAGVSVRAIAKEYRLVLRPIDRFGSRQIYRMRILDGTPPPQKAAQLLQDSQQRIQFAEPNFIADSPENTRQSWAVGDPTGNDGSLWFRNTIRLNEAHQTTRGAGMTVAVLDTGIDFTHPALAGKFYQGFDFVDFDNNPSEEGVRNINAGYGHGTHVSGLVSAVAPDAKILPVRVLDENGFGNIWVIAEALEYAATVDPDGNPATDDKVRVINLSFATRRQTNLLAQIVREVTCYDDGLGNSDGCLASDRLGIPVIAAAGNSGGNVREYPAAEQIDGLLAVGASTQTDTLATFSTYGDWIRVTAPGQGVLSPVPGNLYGVWSGTSMSAPIVAGQAALLRKILPTYLSFDITNRIVSTATPIPGAIPLRIDVAESLE